MLSGLPGLSYWLVPEARGRGLAYAAVRLMMASVVAGSGLRSVVLDIEAGNVASQRLAERLGAERRAPTRVAVDRTGVPRTLVVYVLPVALASLLAEPVASSKLGNRKPAMAASRLVALSVGRMRLERCLRC